MKFNGVVKTKRDAYRLIRALSHQESLEFFRYLNTLLKDGYDPDRSVLDWMPKNKPAKGRFLIPDDAGRLIIPTALMFHILATEFFHRGRLAGLRQIERALREAVSRSPEDVVVLLQEFRQVEIRQAPRKYSEEYFLEVETRMREYPNLSVKQAAEDVFYRHFNDYTSSAEGFLRCFHGFRKERREKERTGATLTKKEHPAQTKCEDRRVK